MVEVETSDSTTQYLGIGWDDFDETWNVGALTGVLLVGKSAEEIVDEMVQEKHKLI